MTLTIDWAWCFTAFVSLLGSVSCLAALTTTDLWLCDSEDPCCLTFATLGGVITACGFCFAIATLNLSLICVEVITLALAPFAPRTFAGFWATRQITCLLCVS